MSRALLILLAICGVVVSGNEATAQKPENFTVLDPYHPWGINNRGEIVGGYTEAFVRLHGFLLAKGSVTTIDGPPCQVPSTVETQTLATRVNNRGQIVGN